MDALNEMPLAELRRHADTALGDLVELHRLAPGGRAARGQYRTLCRIRALVAIREAQINRQVAEFAAGLDALS